MPFTISEHAAVIAMGIAHASFDSLEGGCEVHVPAPGYPAIQVAHHHISHQKVCAHPGSAIVADVCALRGPCCLVRGRSRRIIARIRTWCSPRLGRRNLRIPRRFSSGASPPDDRREGEEKDRECSCGALFHGTFRGKSMVYLKSTYVISCRWRIGGTGGVSGPEGRFRGLTRFGAE